MKNSKALKKTKLVVFPSCIFPYKQNCLQYIILYATNTNLTNGMMKSYITRRVKWCAKLRDWGNPAALIACLTLGRRQQHVAQCCASISSSFMCTNSLCGLSHTLRNGDIFLSENFEKNKIMIWGIHCIIPKKMSKSMASHQVPLMFLKCVVSDFFFTKKWSEY